MGGIRMVTMGQNDWHCLSKMHKHQVLYTKQQDARCCLPGNHPPTWWDHLPQRAVGGNFHTSAVIGASSALHQSVDGVELAAHLWWWCTTRQQQQQTPQHKHKQCTTLPNLLLLGN
jgi:hypothetical protein